MSHKAKPFAGLTFSVQTFGCQMNKHDSERIAGSLIEHGASSVDSVEAADIVVFMTCVVRESAETRLLGHVNSLSGVALRDGSPLNRRIIAVGGCMGQRDGENLLDSAPHVDVVFGTQNVHELCDLILRAIDESRPAFHTIEEPTLSALDLPSERESPFSAWLPITTGCNNFCTYCIVPYVRGREKSRALADIASEAQQLVDSGVKEITLLGQNVNSYGTDIFGEPRFASALDAVDATGIERLRFATSHPKDLTDEVIERFGTLRSLMPALHLPVQSGSDAVLARMNRHYSADHYLNLISKLRQACPDIALSTDIIVGFPGETEEDFMQTLNLVKKVGYTQVFTFLYSPRSGTPAASFEDAVPHDVAQDRFERLFKEVEKGAYAANQADAGKVVEVLVEGTSKRDDDMLTGRSRKNQNVHFPIPAGKKADDMVGTLMNVHVDEARTWYLLGKAI